MRALLLLPVCALVGCGTRDSEGGKLTVFAAASLKEAFSEIGLDLDGVEVMFNFAGSNQLASQISRGAPADVFASADFKAIESARLADPEKANPFAHNYLVIVVPKNDAKIGMYENLANPGIKLAIAAKGVPAGNYAREFLDKASAGYRNSVLKNVATEEENVRAVVTKVSLGEVDAGIVYKSDAKPTDNVRIVVIPPNLNVRVTYFIIAGSTSEFSAKFIDLVLSARGQGILEKHGLVPVSK
ncbi:MAG: molybdate ABC transporter substrate-binding protein [Fimbriimonadales bacterium]